jgi:hypothetical protein
MTIGQIKAAVDAGKRVHWANTGYVVTRGRDGAYLITFIANQHPIGLTNRSGTSLNGQPEDFFVAPTKGVAA